MASAHAVLVGPLERLVSAFADLPAIGPKTASRLAFHLARAGRDDVDELLNAIVGVRDNLGRCNECGSLASGRLCAVCGDESRKNGILCVVADPRDAVSVERSGAFSGRYHVLDGLIAPTKGRGPTELGIPQMVLRISDADIEEAILAFAPTPDADATATYLARLLTPCGVRVTRIATGMSVGAEIEYVDEATLARAIVERYSLAG